MIPSLGDVYNFFTKQFELNCSHDIMNRGEKMKVIPITPRGYCKGVIRAISMAKKYRDSQEPVTILGMIVHNQYVVDALEKMNIKTVDKKGASREDLVDLVDKGTVIISAHGTSQSVIDKVLAKGLNVVDATCLDVIKTHDLIKEKISQGFEILYVGKSGHPESEGAVAIDPARIHLITKISDFDRLDANQKYLITNQTTMSIYDIFNIFEAAKEKFPNLELADEICDATKVRQEAIGNVAKEVDIIYVVGDPHSNNSQKLAQIARQKTKAAVFTIETVQDINTDDLLDKKVGAVTSGASTPTYLTRQVIEYLERFDPCDKSTYEKPKIELDKVI